MASWGGYAAAAWSLGYGLLGLAWWLGAPGFPFGAGDLPDARGESILGGVTAAGGALWTMATVAFQRRTAGACGRCGRRPGRPGGWTSPAAAGRWGRWTAYTAAVLPFGYAVVRWAWALGIPLTISDEFLAELQDTGMVWLGAYLATSGALGGVLTLGLVQRWGEVWPRWVLGLAGKRVPPSFPITFAAVVAVSLASAGTAVLRIVDWSSPQDVLTNPMILWPLWSVALGAAALAYHYRTRGTCSTCGLGEPAGGR